MAPHKCMKHCDGHWKVIYCRTVISCIVDDIHFASRVETGLLISTFKDKVKFWQMTPKG